MKPTRMFALLTMLVIAGCQQQSAQKDVEQEKAALDRMEKAKAAAEGYANSVYDSLDQAAGSSNPVKNAKQRIEQLQQQNQDKLNEVDRLFDRQNERIQDAEKALGTP